MAGCGELRSVSSIREKKLRAGSERKGEGVETGKMD